MLKAFVILGLFVGIILIVIGYINQLRKTPPPVVEYRYIPRTFSEEQDDPARVSQIFNTMFSEPDPWTAGYRLGYIKPNVFQINKNFVSQS